MLNLVLGSSTHAFELMLSAFILGLAFGGLWIQNRIDGLAVPARMLAAVQIAMGFFALSTLPLYGYTFDVMRWLVNTLGRTDQGYLLFNLSSSAIAMAIMLPATFCAGMTLPLITYSLLKQGCGERSIGAVYAANTVGAILGIFFAIHIGFPVFGLKNLITFGAACDIALGLLLFWVAAAYTSKRRPLLITVAGICVVAIALFFFRLDPYKMTSEVYRTGGLLSSAEIEFKYYRDGKTATISTFLEKETGVVAINTNGKTDASINMSPGRRPSGDEPTMILAAVLPMAFHPQAETAANIGLGSGLTTQTLLGNPRLKRVDTVEIEETVVEAAKSFRPRVDLVYTDPRSTVFIEDAKSFFSVHGKKYDIIISEPSNPWVSGVAGLFSQEFYALLNRHLTEEGLFVQWIQLYEVDNDIVLSVLKAISDNFSDFVAYAAHDRDMLIVAKKKGKLSEPDPDILKIPAISGALERVFIKGMQDIALRKIGNKRSLKGLLETSPVRANSDYYPFVDQSAGRTRFLRANAYDFHNLSQMILPVLEMLQGTDPPWTATDVSFPSFYFKSQSAYKAMALRDYCLQGSFGSKYGRVPPAIEKQAVEFRQIFYDCRSESDPTGRLGLLTRTAMDLIPYLRPQELASLWAKLEAGSCAPLLSSEEKNWIALFKAVGDRDAGAMVSGAKSILESGKRIEPDALRFLVASGMVGSLMQGDRGGSFRFWSGYRSVLFGTGQPDLFFRDAGRREHEAGLIPLFNTEHPRYPYRNREDAGPIPLRLHALRKGVTFYRLFSGGFLDDSAGEHLNLKQVEGLGDEHIGIFFDALLHASGNNPRRHHDHFGFGRYFSHPFQNFHTVKIGQKKVEKTELIEARSDLLQGRISCFYRLDLREVGLQCLIEPLEEERIIINNKNLFHHRPCRLHRCVAPARSRIQLPFPPRERSQENNFWSTLLRDTAIFMPSLLKWPNAYFHSICEEAALPYLRSWGVGLVI